MRQAELEQMGMEIHERRAKEAELHLPIRIVNKVKLPTDKHK